MNHFFTSTCSFLKLASSIRIAFCTATRSTRIISPTLMCNRTDNDYGSMIHWCVGWCWEGHKDRRACSNLFDKQAQLFPINTATSTSQDSFLLLAQLHHKCDDWMLFQFGGKLWVFHMEDESRLALNMN